MAIPNNNANQNGPGQGPGSQGPAQTGPKQTKNPLQDMVDAFAAGKVDMQDIAKFVVQLGEGMQKAQGAAEATRKVYKEHSNELRAQVALQDEILATTKKVSDFQRRVATSTYLPNTKDLLKAYKVMEEMSQSQLKRGLFSQGQTKTIKKNMAEIQAAIKRLGEEASEAFEADEIERFIDRMGRLNKDTRDLARNMKGVRLSSLGQDIRSAEKAMAHVFQSKDHTAKYRDYAAKAAKYRQAHELHVQGKHSLAADRRRDIFKAIPKPKFSAQELQSMRRADGSVDPAKSKAAYARHLAEHLPGAAHDRGYSRLGARLFAKHEMEKAEGTPSSVITRMGMHVLARGEGSLGRGVASMGLGVMEGGLSSIAERAAPVLAVLEALKVAFDKNATMNAEAVEKVGGSGLFSGGGNPIDAIHQVRTNLNGPLYSQLGIGYNKNLAIASSLQQAGFSNLNLTSRNLTTDDRGMLSGSFGSFQRNVYGFGRMAGMDPTQTMEQTLKLVTIYKQSLGATEDFFARINKDTRMAGMSTMKYIQLIDEVNGHYNRSNKLIETTIDTMRLLSVTGRSTAEDIKEAMDAATSGGAKRTPEVRAYLASQMFQDSGAVKRLQGSTNLGLSDSISNVAKAFAPFNTPGSGYDEASLQKRIEQGGIKAITQLGVEAKRKTTGTDGIVDTTQLQAMNGALEAADKAYRRKAQIDYDVKLATRNPTEAGLAYSTQGATMGDDLLRQKTDTVESIVQAMKYSGFNLSDALNPEGQARMSGSMPLRGMLDQLGTDPEKAFTLINSLIRTSAQASAQLAKGGMANVDPNSPEGRDQKAYLEGIFNAVKEDGGFGGKKLTGDDISDLQILARSSDGEAAIITALSKQESTLRDIASNPVMAKMLRPIISKEEKDKDMLAATAVSSSTRTTADIWADAFSSFFNRLQTPLDFIAKVMSRFAITGTGAIADDSFMKVADLINESPDKKKEMDALDKEIQELEYQRVHPKKGVSSEETERRLAVARDARETFNSMGTQLSPDSGQRGFMTNERVQKLVDAKTYADGVLSKQQIADAPTGTPSSAAQAKANGGVDLLPRDKAKLFTAPTIHNTINNNSVDFTVLDQGFRQSLGISGEKKNLFEAP